MYLKWIEEGQLCHMCKEPITTDQYWPCLSAKEKDKKGIWKERDKVYLCSEECLDKCVEYYEEVKG